MYKTYFSILLHFGIFHRVGVGQKRLKQDEHLFVWYCFEFSISNIRVWVFSFCTDTRAHIHTHTNRTRVVDIRLDGWRSEVSFILVPNKSKRKRDKKKYWLESFFFVGGYLKCLCLSEYILIIAVVLKFEKCANIENYY